MGVVVADVVDLVAGELLKRASESTYKVNKLASRCLAGLCNSLTERVEVGWNFIILISRSAACRTVMCSGGTTFSHVCDKYNTIS